MCSPVLAGGLAGLGAQQLTDKDKKKTSITNNYYSQNPDSVETGDSSTPAKNKSSLKVGNN